MTDKKRGFFVSILKPLLHLASFCYGAGSGLVKFCYKKKFLKSKKPACKVISIGNISLGGTGKTPTACMLAKKLKKHNKNIALLTRGYGDDEWKMMREFLTDIPVIVGPDRVKNSDYAVSKFGVDTVILDDGFQHWKIKRDLDIVLIDSTEPFGNSCLFPRGVLRETPNALKRADIIMLTKTDMNKDELEILKYQVNTVKPDLPILESVYKPKYLRNLLSNERLDLATLKNKRIAVLASIVNVEYFEFILKNMGANIDHRFYYPDHYNYRKKDLNYITKKCEKETIDTIVTTEKDAVKLSTIHHPPSVLVLHIEPEVTKGEETLNRRIFSLYSA